MAEEIKECEHKWVHLTRLPTREIGYRRWMDVDLFYCERCLAQNPATLRALIEMASAKVCSARERKQSEKAGYWGAFVDWLQDKLDALPQSVRDGWRPEEKPQDWEVNLEDIARTNERLDDYMSDIPALTIPGYLAEALYGWRVWCRKPTQGEKDLTAAIDRAREEGRLK